MPPFFLLVGKGSHATIRESLGAVNRATLAFDPIGLTKIFQCHFFTDCPFPRLR